MDIMAQYPDKYFDLAIVDPPYGLGEDGSKTRGRTFRKDGTHRLSIDKRNGRKSLIFNEYKSGGWDDNFPDQLYFNELFRVSKKQIIFGENYIQFEQKATSTGRIFWDKINGSNDFSDGEMAWTNLFSSVRKIEYLWNGMLQGSDGDGKIVEGNNKKLEKRIHPTQKPRRLYKRIFSRFTDKKMKVLDTHGGSFSSAIEAYYFEFAEFVICEKDKDYFADSKSRFEVETQQMCLF